MAQLDGTGAIDPSAETCDHKVTTRTITAGLERLVCETCAHVSLRYHDQGAFWPESPAEDVVDLTEEPEPKQHPCTACESPAVFMTPYGVACNKHAWIAASKQDSMEGDFWIPLLIDRSGANRTSNE